MPVLAWLLGCGDNQTPPPVDLVGDLVVEQVAAVPSDDVVAAAIAGIDADRLLVASATIQGGSFCQDCLEPVPTSCGAICRRAVLEVTRHRAGGAPDLSARFHEVFPRTKDHEVGALDLVALGEMRAGVAWLECDHAPCGASLPRRSCTARYTTVDLSTGRAGPIETLYQGWYGDLRIAFDPRTRRLLALVGKQARSGVGVRAAIFDEQGATQLAPWASYGGADARAPSATASAGGFVIVADDPAPATPGPAEPCADACECASPGLAGQPTGGLYAFWPGVARPAERIAPGRSLDGAYTAREAIAAIEAGGRVIVASSQASTGLAELFEPAIGGWLRRHSSRAPVPQWLGALGDQARLAWLGSEPDAEQPDEQRLVTGVVLIGQLQQRGELAELAPGRVLQVAPVAAAGAVRTTFLLQAVSAPGGGATPERFEVLAARAIW